MAWWRKKQSVRRCTNAPACPEHAPRPLLSAAHTVLPNWKSFVRIFCPHAELESERTSDHLNARTSRHNVQGYISRGSKGNEKFEFVGMWEDIENLADMDTIPADFLASHPEIKTFSRVFADVQRTASN